MASESEDQAAGGLDGRVEGEAVAQLQGAGDPTPAEEAPPAPRARRGRGRAGKDAPAEPDGRSPATDAPPEGPVPDAADATDQGAAMDGDSADVSEAASDAGGVVRLPEPYYKEPARSPARRPGKGVEAASAPASAATTPERTRVVDELTQTDRGLLVRVGIRWFKVAGQPRITVSASGAPQLGGDYRLRPAPAPKAGQMAEGAAAEDPEAQRDPLAYLYRLQQNRLSAQAEAVGIEFHRIAEEREEPCLVLMFGHVRGLIPAREADAGDGLVGLQRLLGQKVEFQVVHVDPDGGLALLSRKAARLAKRERAEAKVGQVLHAVVRSVLEGGAFVDVGLGVEGFLRAHDYDGRFLADLRRFCRAGDEFEVVVTEMAPGRILVSRAALLPDPWEAVARRYQQGGFYPAKVLAPTPNRAYLMLELPDGTVCYARHPAAGDPVPGTRVTVRLRAVNRERRRLYVSVVGMSA